MPTRFLCRWSQVKAKQLIVLQVGILKTMAENTLKVKTSISFVNGAYLL